MIAFRKYEKGKRIPEFLRTEMRRAEEEAFTLNKKAEIKLDEDDLIEISRAVRTPAYEIINARSDGRQDFELHDTLGRQLRTLKTLINSKKIDKEVGECILSIGFLSLCWEKINFEEALTRVKKGVVHGDL